MNTSLGKYSTAVNGEEADGGLGVVHRRFLAAASSQAPGRKLPVQGESCLHRQRLARLPWDVWLHPWVLGPGS